MQYLDDVRLQKNSSQKQLAILAEKIKNYQVFKKNKKLRRKASFDHHPSSLEDIFRPDLRSFDGYSSSSLEQAPISFKRQNFVKLFIQKLKRNSFNSIKNNINYLDRIDELTQKIDTITQHQRPKGPKGWNPPASINIFIPIITFLTIVCTQYLSAFQCLFDDYREDFSNLNQLYAVKWILLTTTILRMLSKIIFIKSVLGQRLEYIGQLCLSYITNFQFYIDLLMLIANILLITNPHDVGSGIFGTFALILNFIYFEQMNKVIDILVINNNIKKQIFALIKLILANFFIAHLVALVLLAVARLEEDITWMIKYGINDAAWWQKYFYGLYYSATIIFTVGFGDINVSNSTEAIIIALIVLLGCIILSYNITKVSKIMQNLSYMSDRVRNQLSVLDRYAMVTQINDNLHHTISEYIIHVGEIRDTYQVTERHQLVQILPSQLKEDFIQQSSKNFCAKLPFFYMLETETKKRICQQLKTEVMSPNEYVTHKRYGLRKIVILRKGIVGLTYRKKGSQLNGRIVDSISIKSELERPQLLNTYLLIRGKRLLYDIVCQKYCIVSLLQFDEFISSLKQSQVDYQLYHQAYDEAIVNTNQWNRNLCQYCHQYHSLFVCPKMHYAPLRNLVFIKFQKKNGESQPRIKPVNQRSKINYSRRSPLTFRTQLFIPYQKVFQTKSHKSQLLRMSNHHLKDESDHEFNKWRQFQQMKLTKQYSDSLTFEVDTIQNFKYYFHKNNANNLIQRSLTFHKHKLVQIQRIQGNP